MIKREQYLNKLISGMWNGSIKIITGIRRSGKSYLLNPIFYEYLISKKIKKKNIIYFSFESADDLEKIGEDLIELEKNNKKVDYKKFIHYINKLIKKEKKYYLLLDEVQRLESFEYVLNGFLSKKNIDIYVTGSNSKFLSSEVITEFRGRGDEIHLFPLSFKEYCDYVGDKRNILDEYMTYGGLPRVALAKTFEDKMDYLFTQFEKTYIKDVIERNKIRNTNELNELIDIIASGISGLTNPTKLEKSFNSIKHISLTADTINNYIKYLENAFIINKANRYDVKGKKYISTPFKLFFEDVGLRNARLYFRQVEFDHVMENIIYNELRRRGYSVDVGVIDTKEHNAHKQYECDFVANKGSNRYYIQSVYDLNSEKKLQQETKSLDLINDSFKKIIVVNKDIVSKKTEKGYLLISLYDFLMNQNSLDI